MVQMVAKKQKTLKPADKYYLQQFICFFTVNPQLPVKFEHWNHRSLRRGQDFPVVFLIKNESGSRLGAQTVSNTRNWPCMFSTESHTKSIHTYKTTRMENLNHYSIRPWFQSTFRQGRAGLRPNMQGTFLWLQKKLERKMHDFQELRKTVVFNLFVCSFWGNPEAGIYIYSAFVSKFIMVPSPGHRKRTIQTSWF